MLRISLVILCLGVCNAGNAQRWKMYSDSSEAALARKDPEKAILLLDSSRMELKKDSSSTRTYAAAVDKLAAVLFENNKYRDAEQYFTEALALNRKLYDSLSSEYISICNNLGVLYRVTGNLPKAEAYALEANRLIQKVFGKEHLKYASSCNTLGTVYLSSGNLEKAKPFLVLARELRKKLSGESADYATSCNNLAILYVYLGEDDSAIPLYLESKEVRGRVLGTNHPDYAASCNNLGDLYTSLGRYSEAESILSEARVVREMTIGKTHPEYAYTCNNLARLYNAMAEFDKCEQYYAEARQTLLNVYGQDHPSYATATNNMGIFYADLGQFKKAEELYLLSKNIREAKLGKNHRLYSESCNNLGNLYNELEQYEKAEQYHLEALGVRQKLFGSYHPDIARSMTNLANVYRDQDKVQEAIKLYLKALEIVDSVYGPDYIDYSEIAANLAVIYGENGDSLNAEKYFDIRRQSLLKSVGINHNGYVSFLNQLAVFYWYNGNLSKASDHYSAYFEQRQQLRHKVFQFTSGEEQELYNVKNELNNYYIYSFRANAAPRFQKEIYNISINTRNSILTNSSQLRNSIMTSNDTSLVRKFRDWTDLREQLAFWLAKPIDERAGRDSILEDKAKSLEKELTRSSSGFRQKMNEKTISWKTIQSSLKENEAAIEFIEFPYYSGRRWTDSTFYIAMLLKKSADPEMLYLFEKRQLDSLLFYKGTSGSRQFITALYNKSASQESSLYNLVWKPLESRLRSVSTIYFAPAGKLHKIAFSAIRTPDNRTLNEKYNLVQLYTTHSIPGLQPTQFASGADINLYGGIQYTIDSLELAEQTQKTEKGYIALRSFPSDVSRDYVSEFAYLNGTAQEVKRIHQLGTGRKYQVRLLDGLKANEENFKSISGKQSPSIIHIATHGYFFPDQKNLNANSSNKGFSVFKQSDKPLIRSGLALAGANNAWKGKPIPGYEDGILTAYEIANMYLPATKLAVLSACETGLGDIHGSEGVYGLQRAFKIAGVQNLVMSLWKVPDQETAEFMEKFYLNLFAGKSVHAAFTLAQMHMRQKYHSDPYKWAAWVLVR